MPCILNFVCGRCSLDGRPPDRQQRLCAITSNSSGARRCCGLRLPFFSFSMDHTFPNAIYLKTPPCTELPCFGITVRLNYRIIRFFACIQLYSCLLCVGRHLDKNFRHPPYHEWTVKWTLTPAWLKKWLQATRRV